MPADFFQGQIPTIAEWNARFNGKQDAGAAAAFTTLAISGAAAFSAAVAIGGTLTAPKVAWGTSGTPFSLAWSGAPLNQAPLYQFIALSGTNTSGGHSAAFHQWVVDSMDSGTAPGAFATAHNIWLDFGGSTKKGNVVGLEVSINQNATSGNTIGSGFNAQHVAGRFTAKANVNDNGTSSQGWGGLFGFNAVANLLSGATYWDQVIGGEINVYVDTGASAWDRIGFQIVLGSGGAPNTSIFADNVALSLAGPAQASGYGWKYGLMFGRLRGFFGFATDATLIGAGVLSGTMNVAYGVRLDNVTFSTAAFKSTDFTVDGVGQTTSKILTGKGATHANAVNLTGGGAGSYSSIYISGTDTDSGLNINLKNNGLFAINRGGGSSPLLLVYPQVSSDRYVTIGSGTASHPALIGLNGPGNLTLGAEGAIATTATQGYVMLPSCVGVPTGIPANAGNNFTFQMDITTGKVYAYNPGTGTWVILN